MSRNSGFTLIELMVGVAIIGVLTAIAVPNYIEWLPDNRLKDVARGIYGDMQLAKINAIKQHKDWAIVFDPANKKYYVCSDKGADNSWALPNNNMHLPGAINQQPPLAVVVDLHEQLFSESWIKVNRI